MIKMFKIAFLIFFLFYQNSYSDVSNDFNLWKNEFKSYAKEKGITNTTINSVLDKAIYLPKVIPHHFSNYIQSFGMI